MSTVQIVNTILVLLLPELVAMSYVLAQFLIQRLPVHQRAALEQFSRMAVRYVEQEHANALDKKELAMAYTSDFFRLHGLPVPLRDLIEVAVGSARHEIEHG